MFEEKAYQWKECGRHIRNMSFVVGLWVSIKKQVDYKMEGGAPEYVIQKYPNKNKRTLSIHRKDLLEGVTLGRQ